MKKHILTIAAILLSSSASAALVTSSTTPIIEDFSSFSGGWDSGMGPVSLNGGATFTSTSSYSVIGDGHYGMGNGNWTSSKNGFTGLNTASGTMTFTFSQAVSYAGGFINYHSTAGTILTAFGSSGSVLEQYTINDLIFGGDFRGISRSTADIFSIGLSDNYVVLDDLTFGSSVGEVPVPAALLMFAPALLGFMGLRRKAKNSVA